MPGGKNTLQVELGITANTQQAKAALSDLAQSLNRMTTGNLDRDLLGGTASIQKATEAAKELQMHLQSAVNVNTGKLDLGIFSRNLQQAGHDLNYFYKTLSASGGTGNEVFYNLSKSIALSEAPVTLVNKKLTEMGTTLKNTFKWQLSSSVIHGFVGAVEQAYGYAKNLNKSLNDIRIVTGQSAEQMTEFAERANKAAKALSTTTNEYAQASLIYYQQGLSDEEVEGRTNTTIKLANVSRQTAEETSQQLTAVWNNFYDGSKSLEYYADIMTALGAATASSTDEISTGLQKFAATANTVGLSYEYATAALATVTATTRESAQTVGTAFRTLFSRLEGLKLGETLDDGTDLNKYSAALASVGVNIKDVNGDMRSMDNILDDLGDKWQVLAQDQKIALAETIGGARQYTQLMALLDNWDFFEENLKTANSATGTLQEQADIYAQSWEAARDRVRAALEEIYKKLIDENFFIKLADFGTGALNVISEIIDGFGGLGGVLTTIGALFLRIYAKEMPVILGNIGTALFNMTNKSKEQTIALQVENEKFLQMQAQTFEKGGKPLEAARYEGLLKASQLNTQLIRDEDKLSSVEKDRLKIQINQVQQQAEFLGLLRQQIQEEKVLQGQQEQEANKALQQQEAQANDNKAMAQTRLNALRNTYKIRKRNTKNNSLTTAEGPNGIFTAMQDLAWAKTNSIRYDGEAFAQIQVENAKETIQNLQQTLIDDFGKNNQIGSILDKFYHKILSSSNDIDFSTIFDEAKKQIAKAFQELLAELEAQANAAIPDSKDMVKKAKDYGKRIAEINHWYQQANNASHPIGGETPETKKDLEEAAQKMLALGANSDKAKDQVNNLKIALSGFQANTTSAQDLSAAVEEVADALSAAENTNFGEELDQIGARGTEVEERLRNIAKTEEKITQFNFAEQQTGKPSSESPISKKKFDSNALSQYASTLLYTTTIIQSLNNIINSFSTEGIIGGFKNVAAAAPMAIMSILSISSALKAAKAEGLLFASAMPWLIGILIAVSAVVNIVTAAIEKQRQATIDAAKASQERVQSLEEEADAHKELIDSYQGLVEQYQESNEESAELINTAYELATAYGIEGAAVEALKGNYEGLNQEIARARQEELEGLIKENQAAQDDTAEALVAEMRAGRGRLKDDGSYIFNLANSSNKIVKDSLQELGLGDAFQGGAVKFTIDDTSDSKQVLEYYENLIALRDRLKEVYDERGLNINDLTLYDRLKEEIEQGKEQYEALKDLQESEYKYNFESASNTSGITNAKTLADFITAYKEYQSELKTALGLGDSEVDQKILQNADLFLSQLDEKTQQFLQAAQAFGDNANSELINYYDSLSDDEKTLFWKFAYEPEATLETIKSALAEMQEYADGHAITIELDQKDELTDLIGKKNKTKDDVTKIIDLYRQQGFDQILSVQEFMLKSEDEQLKFINAQFNANAKANELINNRSSEQLEADLKAATDELDSKTKAYNEALANSKFDNIDEANAYQTKANIYKNAGISFDTNGVSHVENQDARKAFLSQSAEEQIQAYIDAGLIEANAQLAEQLIQSIKNDSTGSVAGGLYNKYLVNIKDEDFTNYTDEDSQNVIALGQQVAELQGKVDNYNAALNEALAFNYEGISEKAELAGLDIDEVLDQIDVIKELALASDEVADSLANDTTAAAEFAIAVKQTQKGLDALTKNFDDWKEAIKGDDEIAAAEAMAELKDALADTMNITDELNEAGMHLGAHFGGYLKENMDVVARAADGDKDAILELQKVAAEDIVIQSVDAGKLSVDMDTALNAVTTQFNEVQNWLANNQLELGGIATGEALADLNTFINSLTNDVDTAEAILASLGFDAEVEQEEKVDTTTLSQIKPAQYTTTPISIGYNGIDTYNALTLDKEGEIATETVSSPSTVTALKIKTAKYTGGGNISTKSGGTGRRSSKKSGGGKGGGSKQKPKEAKNTKDETERYHVLNAQMEDMKNVLDELSDAKDRAFGKSRLAVMDQEIDKTKQQIELQKEYIQQIEDYLRTDKSAIAAYGAEFDAAGNIVNYDALVAQEVAKYNAAVDKYNAGKIDDDSLETYEKAYKEFQDLLKQYEESNDLYQEQARELINLQHELFDKMLEKIQYGVEYKISLSEDSLEYLDYLLGRIDDDAYDAAQAIALLGEKTAEAVAQQEAYQQGLNDILALHLDEQEMAAFNSGDMSVLEGKDFTDNEIQAIREYKSALLEVNEQLEEIRDTIYEKVLDAFNEMSDELDEQIDKFDYYDSLLEHYQNIIDLTGEKVLGISEELASMLDDARIENATNRVAATKSKLDAINSSLLEAEDALERARQEGSEEDVKKWEEIIEEMTATQEDALDNYLQAWEDALEAINDKFDKQMEESIEKFKKALVPDDQVHSLSELYDRQKEIQDQFLPEYQKIYELSKLNRDINQKLADTDNIRAKEMLLELQKEINEYAEDGVEMSQYDLEYLQKKYDLKLAEIALEEAQNAKNQVKLTRDSEGNYGYVYTANQDNIDKAQQDYEDKLYQLQKTNTDYIEKMEQSLVQLYEDYAEALANIRREDFASQEEYEAALAAEAEYWQQRINYVVNEMDKALGHNKDLYETDWQSYSDATGYKIAADERFLDSFEETILAQETGLTTIEELTNAVADATNTLMDELTGLYATWWEQVQEVYAAAEVPVDEYANYVGEKMDEISEKSAETAENTDEMANQMVEDFQEVANAASEWAATYGKALDEIIKKNEDMVKSFNQLIKELKEVEAELSEYANIKADTTKPPATGSDSKGSGGGGGSGSGGTKGNTTTYKTVRLTDNKNHKPVEIPEGTQFIKYQVPNNPTDIQKAGEELLKKAKNKYSEVYNPYSSTPLKVAPPEYWEWEAYRRGGLNTYTGPAWLDGTPTNPEMVLNATDTRNMLDIISMVRSIVQMVDTNVSTFTRDINLTTSRISSGGLAQDVTIHAEFPNAVNHSEIEQAFDNLINRASQYANRK